MPSAEAAMPEPVYASPTASSIAWMVPSSPNGPCSPMTTTGAGSLRGQPVERGTDGDRTFCAEPARVVVGGGIAVSAPVVGRQPPPRPVEVDQHLADGRHRPRRARSAIADPDTIDTSCSADGPPSSTTIGGSSAAVSPATASHPSHR